MPKLYFHPMTAKELKERLGPDCDDIRGWDADFVRKHLKTFERLNKELCIIVRGYWRPVEKEFFEKAVEFTGYEWKRQRYSCQVWYGTRGCYFYPKGIRIGDRDRGIIAEELFHIHYWDVMKELYGLDFYELKKLPNWKGNLGAFRSHCQDLPTLLFHPLLFGNNGATTSWRKSFQKCIGFTRKARASRSC